MEAYKFCPYCGSELDEHEIEFKIWDCGLQKTWYQDGWYCKKCNKVFFE